MKKCILILFSLILYCCSSSKEVSKKTNHGKFEIVNTPLVVENDTIYMNELRFYRIQSALDGMKLMYENYGNWNKKVDGKHQQNINRIVWSDINLQNEIDEKFTVVADGKETMTDYFACLMVFDSNGKDCFNPEHPIKKN
ncbi:hypothetical protein [Hyunsoonleella rubra]|uniref:Uncharacterized protein n=1 Tax=Hyunsoonleella rubra TaxID=1737062 RepID=A0ABW5T994_9FLAO